LFTLDIFKRGFVVGVPLRTQVNAYRTEQLEQLLADIRDGNPARLRGIYRRLRCVTMDVLQNRQRVVLRILDTCVENG